MEWKQWVGKKVFVQLKSGGYYSGQVKGVEDGSPCFFEMIDKFGQTVVFVTSEIIKIVEEE